MRTDAEIKNKGYKVLFNNMDSIEAEKFISLVNAEQFDYTEWRKDLFEDMSLQEIIDQGRKYAIDLRKLKGDPNLLK